MLAVHSLLISLLIIASISSSNPSPQQGRLNPSPQNRGFSVFFNWPGTRDPGFQSNCFGCFNGYRPRYQPRFMSTSNNQNKEKTKDGIENKGRKLQMKQQNRTKLQMKEQSRSTQENNVTFIGDFPSLAPITHPMSGQVYTKGSSTIVVKNFNYTLPGPDAFFWAGSLGSPYPSPAAVPGYPLAFPNPSGRTWTYSTMPVLPPGGGVDYGDDIELVLPEGVGVEMISWLAVWCRRYQHNFGHVLFNKQEGNQQQEPVPTKFGGGREPRMFRSFQQIDVGEIQVTMY